MRQSDWFKEVAAKLEEAAQAEAASEATPVGGGDLSAAMKMFGAMVVMDREADAQRCARLVGSMPPVQCKDTGRIYHPRKFLPTPGLTALTTAVPAAPAASSGDAEPAAPTATVPVPAANAALRGLHLEARERRASQGGAEPPSSVHGAAPSGLGGVVTLADLPSSSEEDRCAICGGIGVQGVNELVHCGFGDGRCIQELGDAPRRACWHAACEPKLRGKQGQQRVVCARHENDARYQLDVGASGQA